MKITTREFLGFGLGVLFPILFYLISNINISPSLTRGEPYGRIPKALSDELRTEHKSFGELLKPKDLDPDNFESLEGFIFPQDALYEIIRTNKSGVLPDTVAFLFGKEKKKHFKTKKFGVEYGRERAFIKLIAIGIKNGKLLDYTHPDTTKKYPVSTKAFGPSIFDKASPIPPPKSL